MHAQQMPLSISKIPGWCCMLSYICTKPTCLHVCDIIPIPFDSTVTPAVESNSSDLAPMTIKDNGVWLDHGCGGSNALVTRESSKKNELVGSSITIST